MALEPRGRTCAAPRRMGYLCLSGGSLLARWPRPFAYVVEVQAVWCRLISERRGGLRGVVERPVPGVLRVDLCTESRLYAVQLFHDAECTMCAVSPNFPRRPLRGTRVNNGIV